MRSKPPKSLPGWFWIRWSPELRAVAAEVPQTPLTAVGVAAPMRLWRAGADRRGRGYFARLFGRQSRSQPLARHGQSVPSSWSS